MKLDEDRSKELAAEIRKFIITMNCCAGSGHPGGSLSAPEILTYRFHQELNFSPRTARLCGAGCESGRGVGAYILREAFPDCFSPCGMAKQNMMSMAAGLCTYGVSSKHMPRCLAGHNRR